MKKDENFDLWRFMIAKDYQNKHYGSKVLDHIISLGKEEGHTLLMTSCAMGKVSPYKFYMKYGFTDTGITDDDGEQSLSLEIK